MSSSSETPLSETARTAGAAGAPEWRRLAGAASLEDFSAAWLALAAARCGALRGVLVARRPGAARFAPIAFFPEGKPCGTFLADVSERALAEARPVVVEEDGGAAIGIAYPVERGRGVEAVVALELRRSGTRDEDLLRELQWGLPWIERRLSADDRPQAGESPFAAMLAKAAASPRLEDAARVVATELAHVFHRERVGVGVVDEGKASLRALSHTAVFDARLALPRAIEAAMQEAAAAARVLVHPPAEGSAPSGLAGLAQEGGAGSILCVPAGRFAFTLEGAEPLGAEAESQVRKGIEAFLPVLELHRRNDEPLAARVRSRVMGFYRSFAGPQARRRRLVAVAIAAALAIVFLVPFPFRVAGDAVLEGSVRRVMTAPFDGYVARSHARAGDTVKEGASLAALDDRDLRLERVRVASQRAQFARQIQEASAKHDRGQTQILGAQLAQAEAQLELLDEQLARARLVAPFNGLVVAGDLSQSIGSAVRKGDTLFEVAPLAGYRVVVFVDESEISWVAPGQKGTLLLAAIADASFPFGVTSVTPVARTREGRNTFRVEAALQGPTDRLRPGMEGVAKIETGGRSLAWIWTHRFTNWLRLALWSVWP